MYRYCTRYSQLQYRFVSVRKDEMIHLDGIDRFRSFIRISRIESNWPIDLSSSSRGIN